MQTSFSAVPRDSVQRSMHRRVRAQRTTGMPVHSLQVRTDVQPTGSKLVHTPEWQSRSKRANSRPAAPLGANYICAAKGGGNFASGVRLFLFCIVG